MARRMIDVQQQCVEFPLRLLWIKTFGGLRELEEVRMHHLQAGIGCELYAKWDQAALVPVYHLLQGVDEQKGSNLAMLQRRPCRVTQAKPAHDNIPCPFFKLG